MSLAVTQGGSSLSIEPYEGVDVVEDDLPIIETKRRASLSRTASRRLSGSFDRSLTQGKLEVLSATAKLERSNTLKAPVDLHRTSASYVISMDEFST